MPVIYKEKVEYAYTDPGVKAHTLSWAEYQALPTAQKMNGDLYFIPDKQPEGNPSRIWAKIGTEPLDTEAEDVSGAVNELNSSKIDKVEFNTINTTIDISVRGTVNINNIMARSNIANFSLQISSLNGVTANDYLGTIPTKYRPPFETQVFALVSINNAWNTIRAAIFPDGRLKLNWGSQTITSVIICATYICNH